MFVCALRGQDAAETALQKMGANSALSQQLSAERVRTSQHSLPFFKLCTFCDAKAYHVKSCYVVLYRVVPCHVMSWFVVYLKYRHDATWLVIFVHCNEV
jgi:hypothetical protein